EAVLQRAPDQRAIAPTDRELHLGSGRDVLSAAAPLPELESHEVISPAGATVRHPKGADKDRRAGERNQPLSHGNGLGRPTSCGEVDRQPPKSDNIVGLEIQRSADEMFSLQMLPAQV